MHDPITVEQARSVLVGSGVTIRPRLQAHASIAQWIRAASVVPDLFADPRAYASGLNLELGALSSCSPVAVLADRRRVLYQPHPDPRREGWRILIGVAEAELCRRGTHNAADLWPVVAGLAVPLPMRSSSVGVLLERQRWAPEWFLRLARLAAEAA